MSSLIFITDEIQVMVATDTLATSLSGEPSFFTTKAFVIPHLIMVICGTGMSGFLGKWFVLVNDKMVVHGIENLNFHVPSILNSLWADFKNENGISDDLTTTIYHFGFSETSNKICSFAYRSEKSFLSDPISYGIGIKPPCEIPENTTFPNDLKTLMEKQRKIQGSLPNSQRVYIGGEIQVIHLTLQGFNIYTFGRFDDYSETSNVIFDNYENSRNRILD